MQSLIIHYYASAGSMTLRVPDMGLTPREWAAAAFAATHIPYTTQYGVPGALEVAQALSSVPGPRPRRLDAGDRVEYGGWTVQCIELTGAADAWGVLTPVFKEAEPVPVPPGPALYVSAETAPPDAVAYCEDARERLWTGRGAGTWTCLTDAAGRTAPGGWARVWVEYGPLVPLVPVEVLTEPAVWAERPDPHLNTVRGVGMGEPFSTL